MGASLWCTHAGLHEHHAQLPRLPCAVDHVLAATAVHRQRRLHHKGPLDILACGTLLCRLTNAVAPRQPRPWLVSCCRLHLHSGSRPAPPRSPAARHTRSTASLKEPCLWRRCWRGQTLSPAQAAPRCSQPCCTALPASRQTIVLSATGHSAWLSASPHMSRQQGEPAHISSRAGMPFTSIAPWCATVTQTRH